MDKYFNAAREAAQKAGRMLKENIDVPREIFFKGAVDLVTNFDTQSMGCSSRSPDCKRSRRSNF